MPTILNIYGYRFFIYSNEHLPIHTHVEKGNATAKFNIEPIVELVKSKKFNASEIAEIRKLVENNKEFLKIKWYEHFNDNEIK